MQMAVHACVYMSVCVFMRYIHAFYVLAHGASVFTNS